MTQSVRNLKARVGWNRHMRRYEWTLTDDEGHVMAAGEEPWLAPAFQNAHDAVHAVQTWACLGRGKIYNPTGRLDFKFEPANVVAPGW